MGKKTNPTLSWHLERIQAASQCVRQTMMNRWKIGQWLKLDAAKTWTLDSGPRAREILSMTLA